MDARDKGRTFETIRWTFSSPLNALQRRIRKVTNTNILLGVRQQYNDVYYDKFQLIFVHSHTRYFYEWMVWVCKQGADHSAWSAMEVHLKLWRKGKRKISTTGWISMRWDEDRGGELQSLQCNSLRERKSKSIKKKLVQFSQQNKISQVPSLNLLYFSVRNFDISIITPRSTRRRPRPG